MEHFSIAKLQETYTKASNCSLTKEQFETLLTFYPSVLVIMADGTMDKEEAIYMRHIAKFMANSFPAHHQHLKEGGTLEKQFYQNLLYLQENLSQWREPFLMALKEYVGQMPDLKEDIVEVMYMFADSSNDISEEEHEVIRQTAKYLGIESALLDANR